MNIKHYGKITIALIAITLASGCTTLADVKAAKGTGVKATYDASHEDVWSAVIDYINESDLELVTEDKSSGTILAQRGVNLANYGDNVAVFIEKITELKTKVEAVHKKAMETNIFGAWWDERIIKYLDEKFGEGEKEE